MNYLKLFLSLCLSDSPCIHVRDGLLEQNMKLWLEQSQKAFFGTDPLTSPPYANELRWLAAEPVAVWYNLAIAFQ